MIKRVLPFCLLLGAMPVAAQDGLDLVGDRPQRTASAVTVPVGLVQNELGYTHARADGRSVDTLGEWLFRWGAARDFEVRVLVGSLAWLEDAEGQKHNGWTDGGVGLKWTSQHGSGARPTAALLVETSLPTGGAPFQEDTLQPAATIAMDWVLARRLKLGANVGYVWASRDLVRFDQWWGSLALGVDLGAGVGLFVGGDGNLQEESGGSPTGYLDAGLTYRLSPDLLLDVRYGGGAVDTRFVGLGLVWRGRGP